MDFTALFGTIHGFHCIISANFYLYLWYFQQKVFSFSKISESQTCLYKLSIFLLKTKNYQFKAKPSIKKKKKKNPNPSFFFFWSTWPPWYKVNTDGAVFAQQQAIGVGAIIQDNEGRDVAALSKKLHYPLGPAGS